MRKSESTRQIRLKVEALAKERRLSDLQLAHLSGVGVSVIRRMFANSGNIYLTQLAKVAEALNVPICTLIEEDEANHEAE